ncbi:unnamed protein product [Heterobilharzia americana]|nr:unnamed protein product [Heterobilharzia americana]
MVFTTSTSSYGVNESTSSLTEIRALNQNINYPTQREFLKYVDDFNKHQLSRTTSKLKRRETSHYLQVNKLPDNPFLFIKNECIDRLKDLNLSQDKEDKDRLMKAKYSGEKLPFSMRQRYMAAQNVHELILEENFDEFNKYGVLFGPKNLIAYQTISNVIPLTTRSKLPKKSIKDLNPGPIITKGNIDSKIICKQITDNDVFDTTTDTLYHFVQNRRKICLLELMNRVKHEEVKRLDKIIKIEYNFIKKQEKDHLYHHKEYDRYLKTICQHTTEAICLAEGEARKKIQIDDDIKQTRYKLAHLNAEYIKLEEEYLRLCVYRDFLNNMARTFKEHHVKNLLTFTDDTNESLNTHDKLTDRMKDDIIDETVTSIVTTSTTTTIDISKKLHKTLTSSLINENDKEKMIISDEFMFENIFTSPKDLVNRLSELDSTNLTLIENVQEQDEVYESVRRKITKLKQILTQEKIQVDNHIEREKNHLQIIQQNIEQLSISKNTLNEYLLLDKYANVFCLNNIESFQDIEFSQTIPISKSTSESKVKDTQSICSQHKDKRELKPTIVLLLNILQTQVQKVYTSVYGNNNSGAKLDILVMLSRLETTIDELSEMLNIYPRNVILKAKKAVEQRTRFILRQRQKEESQIAYEKRVEKVMNKAHEKPRWRFGRKIMERSKPLNIVYKTDLNIESSYSKEENKSLFQ